MDVSVQREANGRLLVKLAADEREVRLHLSAADIRALVGSPHWHEHGTTTRAGESAGAPVFWTSDGHKARLLIGHDDETRDVAISIPFRVVDEIVRGAIVTEAPVTFTQSYEAPPPDDDLVRRLRAAIASVPDLHEAYLVARRTVSPDEEKVARGVIAQAGGWSRSGRETPLSIALAPFGPPSESAPLGWVAYSSSPVPDEVRGAGIRLA